MRTWSGLLRSAIRLLPGGSTPAGPLVDPCSSDLGQQSPFDAMSALGLRNIQSHAIITQSLLWAPKQSLRFRTP